MKDKNDKSDICRVCKVSLDRSENWKAERRICVTCYSEYQRDYRARNREQLKIRKADEVRRNGAKRRAARLEERREYERTWARAWRAANPERNKATKRRHSTKHRAAIAERAAAFRRSNPGVINARNAARKAKIKAATPPDADLKATARFYVLASDLTKKFGTPFHVDHLMPLAAGGLHHQDNLVVMRADVNLLKSSRVIPALIEFFGQGPRS